MNIFAEIKSKNILDGEVKLMYNKQVITEERAVIMENTVENNEKKDIFDRIMGWGFLKIFEPFYKKNKEVLLYLFFGVMTTVVSFITAGISKALLEKMGVGDVWVLNISTVFSWICAVTLAYITNRICVFESTAKGASAIIKEGASFYGWRVFTLLVEDVIMNIGGKLLGINYWVTKIIANVIVIILNYIISKLFVFKEKKEKQSA